MNGCSKKRKHRTFSEAQAAMQEYAARVVYILGRGPTGFPNVYRCRRCDYFHWGHSERETVSPPATLD